MIELCFNLWYYLTAQQTVSGIAARAYYLGGADAEKGQLLALLSAHDYKLMPILQLPREVVKQYGGAVPYSAVQEIGVEEIYKDAFCYINTTLPEEVALPDKKFFNATPLFDFGSGAVPADICNGFIRER